LEGAVTQKDHAISCVATRRSRRERAANFTAQSPPAAPPTIDLDARVRSA